jgi:hypothetical protein
MSYRSHWTISEPNDIQTALGRVARELQKQQNGFLTLGVLVVRGGGARVAGVLL